MKNNRKIVYLAGFFFSLSIALMSYINSTFLSTFIGERFVGMAYVLGSIVSIIALLIVPQIFRKIGGYKFLLWIIGLNALSILLFSFSKNAQSAILAFIFTFVLNIIVIFSLDELLKISSRDTMTGKTRGAYLALGNTAWIIAQFLYGSFLGAYSFRTLYLVGFFVMTLFGVISYFGLKNIPDPKYDKIREFKYVKEFFKNKNLFRAYKISFLLQFFYCWMVIYTPIYLYSHLGFSWEQIGMIFTVMLLPFVLIEFPLGKYSDKIGERKMLMCGFLVVSIATLSLFFIQEHKVWMWALLLFSTRIGAAIIEVMSDSYFFKHIKPENEEFIGVYRSASPIAYIIGPIVTSIVFIFIPSFNFLFIILGTTMLYGIYLSSTILKTDI